MSRAKKYEPCALSEHIRKELLKLRRINGLNQENFADVLGIKRSAYTKKEQGVSPYSLQEIYRLTQKFGIGLSEILRGFEGFICENNRKNALTNEAATRFPFLQQAIQIANDATTEADVNFLIATLKYALNKLESKA